MLTWLNTLDSSYGIRVGYIHAVCDGGNKIQRFLHASKHNTAYHIQRNYRIYNPYINNGSFHLLDQSFAETKD